MRDTDFPTPRGGLSQPLMDFIGIPSDEQLRTVACILRLEQAVQARLDREAAERDTARQ